MHYLLRSYKSIGRKKILPVHPVTTVKFKTDDLDIDIPQNNLFGISGSSGGALIAFFLSLGLGFVEMESLFDEPYDNDNNQFITYFDYPESNLMGMNQPIQYYRSVVEKKEMKNGKVKYLWKPDTKDITIEQLSFLKSLIINPDIIKRIADDYKEKLGLIYKIVFNYYGKGKTITVPLGAALRVVEDNIQKKNNIAANRFLLNLYSGRGLFVGNGIRTHLQNKLEKYLLTPSNVSRFKEIFKSSPDRDTLSFTQFFALTGVNLIVTGTNITLNKPEYFSKDFTPDFPVVEAIAISMALPPVFKPIFVIDVNSNENLYVDGGMLNNFPIHAFDYYFGVDELAHYFDSLNIGKNSPLKSDVLGFRLTSGASKIIYREYQEGSTSGLITNHINDLINTFLYPSEEGQIRNPQEKNQTIELFTYNLNVSDFNPSKEDKETPIDEAYKKTKDSIQ